MPKRFRVSRKADIKHFRNSSTKTKKINRSVGNGQGGIRL